MGLSFIFAIFKTVKQSNQPHFTLCNVSPRIIPVSRKKKKKDCLTFLQKDLPTNANVQ